MERECPTHPTRTTHTSETVQNTVTRDAVGCAAMHRVTSPLAACNMRVVKMTTGLSGGEGNPETSTGCERR